jgi:hypothetical protein
VLHSLICAHALHRIDLKAAYKSSEIKHRLYGISSDSLGNEAARLARAQVRNKHTERERVFYIFVLAEPAD